MLTFSATSSEPSAETDRTLTHSWVNHERYSGRPGASPSTPADFTQLTYELQKLRSTRSTASILSTAQRMPYETVSTPRNNLRNRVPLGLIHWHRTLEVVTPEQQRQALATGIAPEPMLTNVTILAVAPIKPTTYRGASVELSLSADDYFEETGSTNTIRSLRLDAGDGAGWRDFSIGQDINASYSSTGSKTLMVEVTLSDGTLLMASSVIEVAALATPDPTTSIRLIADWPYNNSTGTVYVYKSGTHAGLRCPVLVAEGFDMENNMDWDVLYNILNKEQLAETLRSYGRDLIVLDYTNAMRSIFENAALARKAITYINANRNNSSDKFTVIGASMGGLVTRIALADMDKYPATYGASHVNTWLSFDSPHEGANIPLGLQEFFSFFQGKAEMPVSIFHFYNLLNTPAAKQMLLVHHFTSSYLAGNETHDTFQSDLRSRGYPSTCKKIAISNGSGYGSKQPFNEGQMILNWDNPGWFFCDVAARIASISTSSSPLPSVFWGFHDTLAWFDETETTQYHYYPYPIDNAPGGYRGSFKELYDQIQSSGNGGSGDYCSSPNHCFIPTSSSLGLSMAYSTYALHYYPSVKARSPFTEIHYSSYNEPHIDINASNKRWFIRAILEDYDTDADGLDDYKEYLTGTAYNSAGSKLTVTSSLALEPTSGAVNLSWTWTPNVLYKVYFTESFARDWTLLETYYWYQNWAPPFMAYIQLPRTTQSGFYKVVAEVSDPVTD